MWQEQQRKRAMRYAEDVLQSPYGPSPGLETGGNLKQGVLGMRFSSKALALQVRGPGFEFLNCQWGKIF